MAKKLNNIQILGLVILFILLMKIGFWPTRVEGHSMEPTFANNNVVVLSKIPLWLNLYDYGDYLIIRLNEAPSEPIIKRLIGKEGDHIVIKDQALYINGELLIEPYSTGLMTETIDYYVPRDHYFVLGDNRTVSKDSRYFGCISQKELSAIVLFKLF